MESSSRPLLINERKLSLFFFLVLLDDRLALRATLRAFDRLHKEAKRESLESADQLPLSKLVRIADAVLRSTTRSGSSSNTIHAQVWNVPKNFDLGPWRQFIKQTELENITTVIWAQLLEVPTVQIASGLQIPEGTVIYRLAVGTKILGTMTPLGGMRG